MFDPRDKIADAIAKALDDPQDVVLARSILGTSNAREIAARVERLVRESLGREVAACAGFTQSVGAVFVLDLDGGARVVLKAHAVGDGRLRSHASLHELTAVYRAQARFADAGFACARVLLEPRVWPSGAVAIMSFIDASEGDDPHDAGVRRAMARGLAESARLGESLAHDLGLPRIALPRGAVFPSPHNALFDFELAGGEWIDERARAARAVLDDVEERVVVMHTDFSAANVRVRGDRIVAVFDMDSVARTDEMRTLASAAVHFTYRGDPPWTWPTRDEAIAFANDYVLARGRPLDGDEETRLDAAAIFAIAYTARCEHALGSENTAMRDALLVAPAAYFG